MKKYLLICLIGLCLPVVTTAQSKVTRFCELMLEFRGMRNRMIGKLNFGEGRSLIDFKDRRMKDSSGNTKRFRAPVDGLNYMSDKGWELVTSVADPKEGVILFFFKKELTAEEAAQFKPELEFPE